MIKEAKIEDIPNVIEVGQRLLDKSVNRAVPVHKPTAFHVLNKFIGNPDYLLLVAEHDERFTGFVMAACEPFWWDDPVRGRRYVTDWAFYSQRRGDGLKMLNIVREWAWTRPRVVEVTIATNVLHGDGASDILFGRAGFQRVGSMYYQPNPIGIGYE